MYEVYSQTRPGRPYFATAVCALLLLLSLVLAALLSDSKMRGNPVDLESNSEFFPAGRVRVRMPKGWNREKTKLSTLPGVVAETRRFSSGIAGDQPTNEVAIVFRGLPRPNGIPSIDAAESIRELVGVGGQEAMIETRSEPARMGSLPAWTLEISPDTRRNNSPLHYIGRAALAPDGQIVGILLTFPHSPKQENRRLLDNMSNSLELSDIRVADKPEQIMKDTGFTFALPTDALLFVTATDNPLPVPRVRMTGGEGQTTWYLEATRVPLVASQTVDQLVEMHARTLLEQLELPSPIQTDTIGKHAVARTALTLPANANATITLWGADVGDQTGLIIVGRHEDQGEEPLQAAAEAIITGTVEPISTSLDLTQAHATAAQHIKDLATEGLHTVWADQTVETAQVFAPTITLRKEVRTYQSMIDKDSSRWWQIDVSYIAPSPAVRLNADIQEKWTIRDDVASHGGLFREVRSRRDITEYRERRLPGSDEVICELAAANQKTADWSITADSTYACEPVLIAAGAKVAHDPESRPAIFTATENYCTQPIHWTMVPIGNRPVPDSQNGETAPAVCMTRDYDPMPIVFYYDQDDSVLAVSFDDIMWQKRTAGGSNPRLEPPRRRQ